jgi:hypothetical protein
LLPQRTVASTRRRHSDCAMTEARNAFQARHFVAKRATVQSVCGLAGKVPAFGDDCRAMVTTDEQQ